MLPVLCFIVLFSLFSDVSRKSGFYLERRAINGIDHLLLCYSSFYAKGNDIASRDDRTFLISSFFEKDHDSDCDIPNGAAQTSEQINSEITEAKRELSLDDFYERLRQMHEHDHYDYDKMPPESEIQSKSLRPILRPYQVKGIKWMLKREIVVEKQRPFYIKLRSKFNNNQVVYCNKYNQELLLSLPQQFKVPSGGLLTGKVALKTLFL